MSYCTNAADDGRPFDMAGVDQVRGILNRSDVTDKDKDATLRIERAAVADYYNWLFDREQERKSK